MTTEYASSTRLGWPVSAVSKAQPDAARERFDPSPVARKITYVGCGVALTVGLALGLVLRPDYAESHAADGPRMVVAGAASNPLGMPTP